MIEVADAETKNKGGRPRLPPELKKGKPKHNDHPPGKEFRPYVEDAAVTLCRNFRFLFREWKKRTGSSLMEFARMNGVGQLTVYRWLEGLKMPSLHAVTRMAESLGVPVEVLFRVDLVTEIDESAVEAARWAGKDKRTKDGRPRTGEQREKQKQKAAAKKKPKPKQKPKQKQRSQVGERRTHEESGGGAVCGRDPAE